MRDLVTLAEQSGASLDDVIERYAWNADFAVAVAEIRDVLPDDFAGAEIVSADQAWIAFKGSPPRAAETMMRSMSRAMPPFNLEVRQGLGRSDQSDDGSALTAKPDYVGTHGDFQWHVGPKVESDDFYAGSSTVTETDLRDVSRVGSPVVGQSLCRNGKNSNKDCQEVTRGRWQMHEEMP